MDNGEIAVVGTWREQDTDVVFAGGRENTIIAFGEDEGATWSDYQPVEGCSGRPMMLSYLGNGVLSLIGTREDKSYRFFSQDYGRTWKERVPVRPTAVISVRESPYFDEQKLTVRICIPRFSTTDLYSLPMATTYPAVRLSAGNRRTDSKGTV